jgi:hypothetical protein
MAELVRRSSDVFGLGNRIPRKETGLEHLKSLQSRFLSWADHVCFTQGRRGIESVNSWDASLLVFLKNFVE